MTRTRRVAQPVETIFPRFGLPQHVDIQGPNPLGEGV